MLNIEQINVSISSGRWPGRPSVEQGSVTMPMVCFTSAAKEQVASWKRIHQSISSTVSSCSQTAASSPRPHPVVANGKLYIRDWDILLCYDVRISRTLPLAA